MISIPLYIANEVVSADNADIVAAGATMAVLAALYGTLFVFTFLHGKGYLAPGHTAPRLPLVLAVKSCGVAIALFATYARENVGTLVMAAVASAVCGAIVGYKCQRFWNDADAIS